MSGNKIAITVSAVDKASARFEAINKRIAAMTAPVTKLQKSFGRLADASGITKLAKGFEDLGHGSLNAFRNVARVVEPLAAITGAASIAGMVKLTESWANFGSQLGFSAQRLGMSAAALQTYQGAAMMAGSSTTSLASGLQTLGQNMWNATGGRSPETVAAFRYLHLSFQNANGSARDLSTMLPLVADKIAGIQNPFAQATVATALFGGAAEDLLPFLRLGSKGMAEYEAKAKRYGVMNAAGVTAANKLRMAQAGLTLAVQGLGNSIAEKLAPVLVPMIDNLANWISANRGLIAQDIAGYVSKFSGWLKTVGPQIQGVIDLFGGWGNAARDLAIFMGVSWLAKMMAPILTVTGALIRVIALMATAAGQPVAKVIAAALATSSGAVATFLGAGAVAGVLGTAAATAPMAAMTRAQIAAARANNKNAGAAGIFPDETAYLNQQAAKYHLNPAFMRALAAQEGGAYDNVSSAGAIGPMQLMPGTASDMGVKNIHDWRQNIDGGVKYFAQLLKRFNGNYNAAAAAYNAGPGGAGVGLYAATGNTSQLPGETQGYVAGIDSMLPQGAPANIGGGTGATAGGAGGGVVKVDITHTNAPAGTTTKATSSGGNVKIGTLKVVKAMPGGSL